jgi:hypothetical protein
MVTHLRAKENPPKDKTIIAFTAVLLLAPLAALHAPGSLTGKPSPARREGPE